MVCKLCSTGKRDHEPQTLVHCARRVIVRGRAFLAKRPSHRLQPVKCELVTRHQESAHSRHLMGQHPLRQEAHHWSRVDCAKSDPTKTVLRMFSRGRSTMTAEVITPSKCPPPMTLQPIVSWRDKQCTELSSKTDLRGLTASNCLQGEPLTFTKPTRASPPHTVLVLSTRTEAGMEYRRSPGVLAYTSVN